jgi:DNA-binding beta-propeller fold protein YncE
MIRITAQALIATAMGVGICGAADPLRFEKSIPLPNVNGRIDHMAADPNGGRLFVAALGNKTLEVIDWNSGKRIKSIASLDEPQGIVYRLESNRLYVATGGDGSVRVFEGSSFMLQQTIKLGDDADNLRFDAALGLVWAGYGGGALAAIDDDGQLVANIRLSAHPESFQLEHDGPRIFVNLPRSRQVAVVDREKKAVIATWGTGLDFSNFPMTFDEKSKRLFIVCRVPARLLVMDTDSGKIVAKMPTIGDSDDVFYDSARHRLYVTGGGGAVVVYDQRSRDQYEQVASIRISDGARTSLFVPEADRLFVAVPHRGAQLAEIRIYRAD